MKYEDFMKEFEEVEKDTVKKYSSSELDEFSKELEELSKEELKDVVFEEPAVNLDVIQKQYLEQQISQNQSEIVTKSDVQDITDTMSELGLLNNDQSYTKKKDPLKAEREAKEKFLAAIRNK
jgi:hypothetical protein